MSASIDNEQDPTEGGSAAREVLVCWLETHAAGECDAATMQAGFLEGCRMHPDAPWDALALLDQYQRRNKLEPPVAAILKREIEQMVFGSPGSGASRPRAAAARVRSVPPAQPSEERAPPTPRPIARDLPPAADLDEEDEEEEEEDDGVEEARTILAPKPKPQPQRPSRTPPRDAARVLRGRYELQDVIGRGADGVVYRALDRNRQHLDETQRYVAIKLLHNEPPLSGDALVEFLRRAHQAQTLVHPSRVRVLDFDADGAQRFLVMDYVPGHSLSHLLERDSDTLASSSRVRAIISDIGVALTDAHEHGLAMGNLTPRKIIVTPGGDARLIDVGFTSAASRASFDTEPYVARYASAECIEGAEPTASDDVYSFACIAYELLARRHPYDGLSGAAARAQRLRPERIPTLSHSAWNMLERALRWDRVERDVSALRLSAAIESTELLTPADVEPAIRAMRREPAASSRQFNMRWLWICVLVVSLCAIAWLLLTPSEQAEVRDDLNRVEEAAGAASQPSIPAQPPADTARTLKGGQFIPAQPTTAPAAGTPPATDAQSNDASAVPAAAASGTGSNGVLGFATDTYVVNESDVVVRIPVARSKGTRGEVSFRWWTQGGTAEADKDFGEVQPTREFIPAGQSSTVLHIPLVSDSVRESTESFTVHIDSAEGGARLGDITEATVIIVDDD